MSGKTYENSLSEFLREQFNEDLVERLNIADKIKNFLESFLVLTITPTQSDKRKQLLRMMFERFFGKKMRNGVGYTECKRITA